MSKHLLPVILPRNAFGAFLASSLLAASAVAQTASVGPSTSTTPYVLGTQSYVNTTSVLSVGDSIGGYQMVGLPDGLGAYDNGNGTFTLLMNHELGNTSGALHAHGAAGAFISEWVIDKTNFQVLSGGDLIKNIYNWNTATQSSNAASSTIALNRLCSADLASTTAFYNSASGLGTTSRLFLNGEEGGATGYALASVATGAAKGSTYVLGKFNPATNGTGGTAVGGWENLLANPFQQDKTVVIGNSDGGTGVVGNAVGVYVGTKTNFGTEADRAGLTNGVMKFVNVAGSAAEIVNSTTRATNISSGAAFTLSSSASTTFSRPEDGAWNPLNANQYYFVTTDRLDTVKDGLGSQVGKTRLWRLNFADIANPDLGGTIDLLLDGASNTNMFDNMTVTADGKILLQEDVGGAAHNGKVWMYDPTTGALTQIAMHDPARFGDVGVAATLTNDEETSGIIDITNIIAPADGSRWFLTSDQAHYANGATLVEGGQLVALQVIPEPGTYAAILGALAAGTVIWRRRRRTA